MPPLVSILVPLYNHERYIAQALESIQAQSMPDFEALVLNDGSTDRSAEIAASFAQRDARIHLHHQRNAGIVTTMNNLAAMARGKFIATLDSDDFYAPQRLQRGLESMQRDPTLAASFCSIAVVDGDGNLCDARRELKRGPIAGQHFIEQLVVSNFLASCGCFLRASALDKVGPFARDFDQVLDWDLWLRMACVGHLRLEADIGTFVRWDGNNMSSKNVRKSSAMQLQVSKELVGRVASFHGLSDQAWGAVHACRAGHARLLQDYPAVIAELGAKARLGLLGGHEYWWLIEGLFAVGRHDAALHLLETVLAHPHTISGDLRAELQTVYHTFKAQLRAKEQGSAAAS